MGDRVTYCRRLKPAVEHAVGTFGIATQAVFLPIGFLHERLETRGIPLICQQITGPLPPEDVAGRDTPGGALVGTIAGQKVEVETGVVELPPAPLEIR
jgi:hypothetical protein